VNGIDCLREEDVLDAVASGRWPDRVAPDLEAHVERCAICADLVVVAGALADEYEVAWREAEPPESQVVWWRAQVRAREQATRAAVRPIAAVQAIALVSTIAVLLAVASAMSTWPQAWANWLEAFALLADLEAPGLVTVAGFVQRGVVLALAVWLLLAPVGIYLAVTDD
jgi:hypothetical protein